ncbi:hypothetical protein DFJ73DRAFT_949218 [Zopfochytrium polystomum]|nr:hypothetical protein DFJ73DRAFT_949218 [Zopfochytrium polystomum]
MRFLVLFVTLLIATFALVDAAPIDSAALARRGIKERVGGALRGARGLGGKGIRGAKGLVGRVRAKLSGGRGGGGAAAEAPAEVAADPTSIRATASPAFLPEITRRILASIADARTLARLCCPRPQRAIASHDSAATGPVAPPHDANADDDGGGRSAASWKQLYGSAALDRCWLSGRPAGAAYVVAMVHSNVTVLRRSVGWEPCPELVVATATPGQVRRAGGRRRTVLTGSHDRVVRVLDVVVGMCRMVLRGHDNSVAEVGWIGAMMFSASPSEAKVWDGATDELVQTFESARAAPPIFKWGLLHQARKRESRR